MLLPKYKMSIALVLSGLVHGIILFNVFESNQAVQAESVSIAVTLLPRTQQPHQQTSQVVKRADSKQPEKVIEAQGEVVNVTSDLLELEKIPVRNEKLQPFNHFEEMVLTDKSNIETVSEQSDENNIDHLLSLVHQDINRHKQYPYLAKRQGHQGVVKLSFILHPDGQVSDVLVVQSSRFSLLDKAARKAVEAISPFLIAAEYLQYQQNFDVDIDFRLN